MEGGIAIFLLILVAVVVAIGGALLYFTGAGLSASRAGSSPDGPGTDRRSRRSDEPGADSELVVEDLGAADVGPDDPSPRRARVHERPR